MDKSKKSLTKKTVFTFKRHHTDKQLGNTTTDPTTLTSIITLTGISDVSTISDSR